MGLLVRIHHVLQLHFLLRLHDIHRIPILIFETTVFFLVAHRALRQWGIKILRNESQETIGAKLVAVLFYDSFIYFARYATFHPLFSIMIDVSLSVFVLFTTLTFLFRYTSVSSLSSMNSFSYIKTLNIDHSIPCSTPFSVLSLH